MHRCGLHSIWVVCISYGICITSCDHMVGRTVTMCLADSNPAKQRPITSYWSKNSKLFGHPAKGKDDVWTTSGVQWIANTTRGTNNYSECSHAIYLYDQHPNPQVENFLNRESTLSVADNGASFSEHYALTELVQWLFRFQIRKGGFGITIDGEVGCRGKRLPTTVYVPSVRMRNLLVNWLETGEVSSKPLSEKALAA